MCQDEMDQVMELSERLIPSLDVNDKETLHQLLKSTDIKLNNIMSASQRKQELMFEKSSEWQEFQVMDYFNRRPLNDCEAGGLNPAQDIPKSLRFRLLSITCHVPYMKVYTRSG